MLFVPHTPKGELAKMIQSAEDVFSKLHNIPRIKVVERGGCKLLDQLGSKDPWAPSSCGETSCLICNSKNRKKGTPSLCRVDSVCYQISCDNCAESGVAAQYVGESSRTGFLRGEEHFKGHERTQEENALTKHDMVHHEGRKCTYSMKILRRHCKPLSRQVQEATTIENTKASIVMNSKGEFNGCRVPRVMVEQGARIYTNEYSGNIPNPLPNPPQDPRNPPNPPNNSRSKKNGPNPTTTTPNTHQRLITDYNTVNHSQITTTNIPTNNTQNIHMINPTTHKHITTTPTTNTTSSSNTNQHDIQTSNHDILELEEMIKDMEDWEKMIREERRKRPTTVFSTTKRINSDDQQQQEVGNSPVTDRTTGDSVGKPGQISRLLDHIGGGVNRKD